MDVDCSTFFGLAPLFCGVSQVVVGAIEGQPVSREVAAFTAMVTRSEGVVAGWIVASRGIASGGYIRRIGGS